jgi:hypothetical protein
MLRRSRDMADMSETDKQAAGAASNLRGITYEAIARPNDNHDCAWSGRNRRSAAECSTLRDGPSDVTELGPFL